MNISKAGKGLERISRTTWPFLLVPSKKIYEEIHRALECVAFVAVHDMSINSAVQSFGRSKFVVFGMVGVKLEISVSVSGLFVDGCGNIIVSVSRDFNIKRESCILSLVLTRRTQADTKGCIIKIVN